MERTIPVFHRDMAIEEISKAANDYIEAEWKSLYDYKYVELTAAFAEIEDAAYGVYLDELMPRLFDQLEDNGFDVMEKLEEEDFVIGKRLIFRNSLEKWGTEDNRFRIFWNIVRNRQGNPVGTLLTEIPHSHLRFEIPSPPVTYALRETVRELIVQGIRRIKESD